MQEGKLLVIKQQTGPHAGKFDLPGGGIELGETIEEALCREFVEEVAMTFEDMHSLVNLTAVTEGLNDDGFPYLLHQIGLIYEVTELFSLPNHPKELEFFWVNLEELEKERISPFLEQMLLLI